MKTMKRTINFLDAQRNKVALTVEITERNGYPEFTASADCKGHGGQCEDEINPLGENQTKLIKLWDEWHLNNKSKPLPENFEDSLNTLLDDIEAEEEEKRERKATKEDGDLFQDFSESETAHALALMLELSINEIEDIEENDNNQWTVQGVDYLAGTDDEMDEAWDEELENYIDECILPDVPENVRMYFDNEKWKDDARMDGRGHALNRYDGGEESISLNGVDYYAYRQ